MTPRMQIYINGVEVEPDEVMAHSRQDDPWEPLCQYQVVLPVPDDMEPLEASATGDDQIPTGVELLERFAAGDRSIASSVLSAVFDCVGAAWSGKRPMQCRYVLATVDQVKLHADGWHVIGRATCYKGPGVPRTVENKDESN